jgi:hypothetical protein
MTKRIQAVDAGRAVSAQLIESVLTITAMKQIRRSESGGGSPETRETLPAGNAVERSH